MNMNCRALFGPVTLPINWLVFFVIVIAVSLQAKSVEWSQLASKNLKIENESVGKGHVFSTYPPLMQTFYAYWYEWEPDKATPPECKLDYDSQSFRIRTLEFREFYKENFACTRNAKFGHSSVRERIARNLSVDFNVDDTNHFRKVEFTLPRNGGGEVTARGLMGIKDDLKPRPWLILRMGVHGSIDEFVAERFIAKAAYEDFDFNFLVLENLTSDGYIQLNQDLTFGGIDEGFETYFILKELKQNKKLNVLIKEIHLLGISLGGPGVFVTNMLDELNEHQIKTATTFCPVIDLKATMEVQYEKGFTRILGDLWNTWRLQSVFSKGISFFDIPWWRVFFKFEPQFVPYLMKSIQEKRTTPVADWKQVVKLPLGFDVHLSSSENFYELNNFWKYYQNEKTPFLIVTTPNDYLVPEKLNSDLISDGAIPGVFNKTQRIHLERGIHCGFPPDYSWSYILSLLRIQWGI